MSVCSTEFLIILSSVSASIFFIPSVAARQFTLATYAALFLYSQGVSAVGLLVLAAFLLSGY